MSLEELAERIARLEEKYLASQQTAILVKEDLERRLHAMNEFRDQLTRERITYLTRDMYDREHQLLVNRTVELEKSRAGALGTIGAYGSIVAIIVSVIAAYLSWVD